MIAEQLAAIRGEVIVELDGVEVYRTSNLVVNVGYARLARFLAGQATVAPSYIAVGNVASPVVAAGDTALGSEVLRKVLTSQAVLATYTARLVAVFTSAEAVDTLTEVGLFDLAAAGNMYARAVINVVKGAQQMNVIWQIQTPAN